MPSEHSNRGAKRAREARVDLGLTRAGPLPDLLEAVEGPGGAHVVVLALPDGVAGAYAARPDCPLIFVNARQHVSRQRFTLAHEFGHFRMDHGSVVDSEAAIGGGAGSPEEVSANAFAAELLMPRDAVAAWATRHVDGAVTLEHVVALAYAFGVSAPAARYALATASVLRDDARADQLDREIADELHLGIGPRLGLDPLSDALGAAAEALPRLPAALQGSVLANLLAGREDVAGAAHRLGRSESEVDAMLARCGLPRTGVAAM